MSQTAQLEARPAAAPAKLCAPVVRPMAQRNCDCGNALGVDGEYEESRKQGHQGNRAFSAATGAHARIVPPLVHDVLRSHGQPLDPATRAFMEPRFGHDFSKVRVHSDAQAAESARAVGARAYTVGCHLVFSASAFAPATHEGRELIAHELAHTIQQRLPSAPAGTGELEGVFESTARDAARSVANGGRATCALPPCGIGLARSPVPASAFDDDELARRLHEAARNLKPGEQGDWWVESLRGEVAARANRQRTAEQGRLRAAAAKQAEIARAAAAQKQAKEAADRVAAVAEAVAVATRPVPDDDEPEELPVTSMALGSKRGRPPARKPVAPPPRPRKPAAPSKFSPGAFTNADIYGATDAANQRIDEQVAKDREISKRSYQARLDDVRGRLQRKSDHWYSGKEALSRMTGDEVWREGVSEGLFIESEKRGVYEDQNSLQQYVQDQMEENRKRSRAKFESDQYRALIAQRDQFRSPVPFLQPFAFAAFGPLAAAAYGGTHAGFRGGEVYNACANGSRGACVEAMAKFGATVALDVTAMRTSPRPQSGGGGDPAFPQNPNPTFHRIDVTHGGPFVQPQMITPSRPVAGFGRPIEPAPAPVPAPDQYLMTQMPGARVVQGDQPAVGNLKPAYEIQGPPTPASPRAVGFRPPPKDIAERPGLIENEMGPREYVRREYLGDVNPAGEQQARYYVNIKLDSRSMMDSDVVLRGGGKRSGALFGKEEFLAAKENFERSGGPGSVQGAYGRWGGGDNIAAFNTRYGIATGKGHAHAEAMIEAAQRTKTGEWSRAAGFNNVKVTKAEGSPGAFTNVEVEFTK
jgi:hypothetical protein